MAYTTIDDPTIYFNTKLYTGNGSTQSITGVGFQPDWLWIKNRDGSNNHILQDVVRGATKSLESDGTPAETTSSTRVTSFDSDGFSVGSAGTNNTNSNNYVSWNWLAGGSASSNSDGSVTTSVSVNTTAGFSIVSYTGTQSAATFGHGLGALPGMLIIKNRTSTDNRDWAVYHKNLSGNNKYLSLNLSSAELTDAATFNNTAPTSTVFSSASSVEVNESSKTFIAYCFTEIKGYSKFGIYTGNGNANGTFVYTGFKPAWLMIKSSSLSSTSWVIHDNKRDTFNIAKNNLDADNSDAEANLDRLDILSNGFKSRSTLNFNNRSGETYIYMAFAECPLVGDGTNPTTAR